MTEPIDEFRGKYFFRWLRCDADSEFGVRVIKKIFSCLLAILLCLSLCACEVTVPSELSETGENFIGFSTIPDKDNLYYNADTKIVYIIFKERKGYGGYGFMSPYYAPNGFPYQYDANERSLIEIDSSMR